MLNKPNKNHTVSSFVTAGGKAPVKTQPPKAMKSFLLELPETQHQALRIYAMSQGQTLKALIQELLDLGIKEKQKEDKHFHL